MSGRSAKPVRISLREDVSYSKSPHKVDRDKGVIYHVKVLGWDSKNGRKYLPEDVRKKLSLYNGVPVNIDHPDRPGVTRDSADRFGRLVDPVVESDGVYANLEFLKSHPMAERLCEAAERMPEIFGLSHNADGATKLEGGQTVVVSIEEVRSVDVVTQPATTDGLFEGRTVKTKLKSIFESLAAKYDGDKRKRVQAVLEMDDMPMDAEAEPSSSDSDYKRHLLSAVAGLLDSEDEDSLDKVDAIMKILKPEKPKETEEEEEDGDADKDKDKMESVRRELDQLKRKDQVRELCESQGVLPSKPLLKALVALDDAFDRKALLEEHKKTTTGSAGTKIRSQGPGRPTPDTNSTSKVPVFESTEEGRKKRMEFLRTGAR